MTRTSPPPTRETPPRPSTRAQTSQAARARPTLMVLVVFTVGAVLVAGVSYAVGRQAGGTEPKPAPTAVAPPSTSVDSATHDPADTVPPSEIPVLSTVVPGLWLSTASVTSGNASEFMGVRVGWPRNLDGAIGAAMNYQASSTLLARYVDASCTRLETRLYTADKLQASGSTPDELAELRKIYNLNPKGQPLGANGKVDPAKRFYGGGEPRYGAFKVLGVSLDANQTPTQVRLLVMLPIWAGVGTDVDISGVSLYFRQVEYVMEYLKGTDGTLDWRVAETPSGKNLTLPDMARSNPGYQVLRNVLGPGWAVAADSTEKPVPGALMSK